ncbi:hypothetical protein BDF19DRAFT_424377 [Syncephalis fuscata]|nr:hypothetical protein BDF19DRAFT_424377 [Syncephalis fuscata]
MSSKLVKQTLLLLSTNAGPDRKEQGKGSKLKHDLKTKLSKRVVHQASKHGIKKERERQKKRCAIGNLERAVYLHRTADPLDLIRNEETTQQQRLKENLAYLKKSSFVSIKEAKLRQRVMSRLNEEAAARQNERQRSRQHKQQLEADASDEEWAALDD